MSNYQGWTNEATWCVWCMLNNEKSSQDEALNLVRRGESIIPYCAIWRYKIEDFAPWVWKDWTLSDVNWKEVEEGFRQKIMEGQ